MHYSQAVPTKFAMLLCSKVELFGQSIYSSMGMHSDKDEELFFALHEFQQMIIGGATFDEAMLAYHGMDLSEEQITVLKIVDKSTKPWLLGHVGGILLDKLNSSKDKDMVNAAEILLHDIMKVEGGTGTGTRGLTKEMTKKLIVKLADKKETGEGA